MDTNSNSDSHSIHLSNYAIRAVLQPDQYRVLGYTYEDTELELYEDGMDLAEWITSHAPGKFVIIDTGDYIHAPCNHFKCEMYDPNYRVILIPQHVWEQNEEALLQADHLWRHQWSTCQLEKG